MLAGISLLISTGFRYKPEPRERITITNLSFESLPSAEDAAKLDKIYSKVKPGDISIACQRFSF